MRKLIVITAVICAALLCSCSNNSDVLQDVTEFVPETEIVTEAPTMPEVTAQAATVKKTKLAKKVKKKTSAPKATEAPEATEKPTSTATVPPLPTQGAVKPGRQINVTIPRGSISSADLDFIYGDITVKLNQKIQPLLNALSDSENDADDKDKDEPKPSLYDFDDFSVNTYVSEGVERIKKITVLDESYSTKKGATTGMYASRLRWIYGDPIRRSSTAYVYGNSTKNLIFFYENNIVTGIEFRYVG